MLTVRLGVKWSNTYTYIFWKKTLKFKSMTVDKLSDNFFFVPHFTRIWRVWGSLAVTCVTSLRGMVPIDPEGSLLDVMKKSYTPRPSNSARAIPRWQFDLSLFMWLSLRPYMFSAIGMGLPSYLPRVSGL